MLGENCPRLDEIEVEHATLIPPCDWPSILYPNTIPTPPSSLDAMAKVQSWAKKHRRDAVVYLQGGGLLGMYRDGALVTEDSDIDIRFGVRNNDPRLRKELTALKADCKMLSFINLYEFGDKWNSFYLVYPAKQMSNTVIDKLSEEVCLPPRSSPLMTHQHVRKELEKEYGAFWFVKIPFKAMLVNQFEHWSNAKNPWNAHWRNMIQKFVHMDKNNDRIITSHEVNAYVINDGIDVAEYNKQISKRDRCRAASMITWLLDFDQSPHAIHDDDLENLHGNHLLFRFPECNDI
jgi:hypothetical protein